MDLIRFEVETMPKYIKKELTAYCHHENRINDLLRRGVFEISPNSEGGKILNALDTAFALVTPLREEIIVYTSVPMETLGTATIPSFITVTEKLLPEYGRGDCCFLVIHVPAGTSILQIPDSLEGEGKIILYRGGSFIQTENILGIDPYPDKTTYELHYIQSSLITPQELEKIREYMTVNKLFLEFLDKGDTVGFARFITTENHKLLFRCIVGDTEIRRRPLLEPYFNIILERFPDVVGEIEGLASYIGGYPIERQGEMIYRFEYEKLPGWFRLYIYMDVGEHPLTIIKREQNCSKTRRSLDDINPRDYYLKQTCDYLPLEDVEYVYGPVSYTEFKLVGKNVGIFGEIHKVAVKDVDNTITVSTAGLLNSILKENPDKFYDFFLELGFLRTREDVRILGISSFNHLFKECLTFVKSCPYDNLRAHYIDYRSAIDAKDVLSGFIDVYLPDADVLALLTNPLHTPQNLELLKEKVRSMVLDFFQKDKKLQKEILSIKFQCENYFRDTIIELDNLWSTNIFPMYVKFGNLRYLQKAYTNITDYILLIMDVYALGRIFKTFDITKNPTHPKTSTNCIVYAGNAHALQYIRFFRDYLHIEPTISLASDSALLQFTTEIKSQSFLFN